MKTLRYVLALMLLASSALAQTANQKFTTFIITAPTNAAPAGSEAVGTVTAAGTKQTTVQQIANTNTKVSGVTVPPNPVVHQVLVVTSPNQTTWKTVPDCQDLTGNHLNYVQSTDSFVCGNTSSGGGTGAVSSVTAGNAGVLVSPTIGAVVVSSTFPSQTFVSNHTFVVGDLNQFSWFNAATPLLGTIPAASGQFGNGAAFCLGNRGTSTVTMSPQTSIIYGVQSLVVGPNKSVCLVSDGSNWGAQLSDGTTLATYAAATFIQANLGGF